MEIAARLLVVSEISEDACFRFEGVRPIRIAHACRQNKQVQSAFDLSAITKSTLAIDTHQLGKWVIASIPIPSTLS